jgi:SAM-dependent methyltransferase
VSIHELAARGFERAADEYEQGRPGYPEEAIASLAQALGIRAGATVVDLGAGTGKLTRRLHTTGARLVAVEPVEAMRRKLAEALPDVRVLAGTAEAIPLAAKAADAVVVGQAFHWFRGDAALREIHRVLRREGRLGLIWNARDESVDWVAGLSAIIQPYEGDAPRYASGRWREAFAATELFTPLEARQFAHNQEVSLEIVKARIASTSFIAALPDEERQRVLRQVEALLRSHGMPSGQATVALPYRTDVYWCGRRTERKDPQMNADERR